MSSACEIVMACTAQKTAAQELAANAIEEVARIERKYSRYRKESIISRINAAAGKESVVCDAETLSLLHFADTLFSTSGGLFDITAGVLRKGWDFSRKRLPEEDELLRLLPLIGWQDVERDKERIRLPVAGMEIDFGGFGKEYAADRAASMLHAKGVRHGYVNLAGDIRLIGPKPDDAPWVIGIQDPRQKDKTIASIPLHAGALATSGDYERYFESDGKRYCHIIHPWTGYPVSFWQSVTVVAPLAVTAGSYSTIAMLKEREALAFLDDSAVGYLAVDSNGKIYHKECA